MLRKSFDPLNVKFIRQNNSVTQSRVVRDEGDFGVELLKHVDRAYPELQDAM